MQNIPRIRYEKIKLTNTETDTTLEHDVFIPFYNKEHLSWKICWSLSLWCLEITNKGHFLHRLCLKVQHDLKSYWRRIWKIVRVSCQLATSKYQYYMTNHLKEVRNNTYLLSSFSILDLLISSSRLAISCFRFPNIKKITKWDD